MRQNVGQIVGQNDRQNVAELLVSFISINIWKNGKIFYF